jgi:hypothetical protein
MSNYFLINPKEERLNQLREEALNQMKQEFFLMEFDGIKRAVKYFKIIRKKRIGGTSDFYDLAINALERQVPQEGVGEEGYPNCPKCGTGLIGEYCYECGQRTLKP